MPTSPDQSTVHAGLDAAWEALLTDLRAFGKVAIAFSGGVDSTFLLHAAKEALGAENVLALTAETELNPNTERAEAARLAAAIGVRQRVVHLDVLSVAAVASNPPDRCYHCKTAIFGTFLTIAREEGFDTLCDGSNVDDLGDYRPGHRAVKELGVRSPLLDRGMGKAEIRALSRRFSLPTAEKPSFACLASRIPYGTPLSADLLRRIEEAETVLRDLGFVQYRVRVHGDVARIEVVPDEIPRLLSSDVSDRVHEEFHRLGFLHVSVDLKGYRTGSLNEGGLVAGLPEELA